MTPAVPLFFAAVFGALVGCRGIGSIWIAGTLVVVFGLGALLSAGQSSRRRGIRALSIVGLAASLAYALALAERVQHQAVIAGLPLSTGVLVLDGIATDVAPARSGGAKVVFKCDGALTDAGPVAMAAVVHVRLVGGGAAVKVEAGDRIRVRGVLRPLLPAYSPGTFDAALFGLSRGAHARLSVFDSTAIAVVERGAERAFFASWRNLLRERLGALVTPREAGVLLALIVGDTASFDREQLDVYRSVGAGHLLAVSGLQVSLLAWLVFVVARFLFAALPWSGRRGYARLFATVASMGAVAAFVLLCGAPPSCVRAGVMAGAVLLAALLGRRARALDALGVGGLATVLLAPVSVIDPSFLLSYAAVLGLVAVGAPTDASREDAELASDDEASRSKARLRLRMRQALAVIASALAAGVVTLPVSAHLFGEISPGGIAANVLLVPIASLLQIPAIGLGLLGGLLGSSFVTMLGASCAGMLEAVTEGLSLLVGGVVPVSPPNGLQAIALTAAAVLFALYLGQLRRIGLAIAAIGIALVTSLPGAWEPSGVRIAVLPVGQGDGAVFEMETGEVLVVDGGGVWDERVHPGEQVVLPFLRRRGIDRVHAIVLSHPDPDHLLGLLDVMAKIPVDELWHSGFTRDHPLMRRLLDLAAKKKVRVRTARDLAPAQMFGATRVEILTPFPEDGSAIYDELSPNENSLTLRVVHGADSALWPGDLEAWGERYLMRDGAPLKSTIHKAGHHGSRTSSTQPFVDKVAPEIVVFPTGPDNQWGFPHAEVVERWRRTGARLFDTAQHGEITFFLTGAGVRVHPFRVPEPLQGWASE